ncbi:AraC family ethanolamine operon transcriptional activator [Sinobacterium caligoides]|uniref:AraC family ethanolamine operon transcriptional activator n=1 Tax=Sinobacterium caligoides TaxID=933926 RepID=A0A3N2DZV1_9GAMM|nr:helix-turn-helix domain-containing protein [Sinobacterium caligoides]ROS05370.1 AraC family ethanolamine operon transcriptional activator [Sinobacterium caligoides]
MITPNSLDAPTVSTATAETTANSTSLHRREAFDADRHAANLSNWQQRYDQLSCGHFYGDIVERPLDNIQLFREHTSQSLRQRCQVWPDSIWLGIPAEAAHGSRIDGLVTETNSILCRPGDCEFELITPAAFTIYGIVVSRQRLLQYAQQHAVEIDWQLLCRRSQRVIPTRTLDALRYLLQRLLSSQPQHAPALLRQQSDITMMALLEVLQIRQQQPTVAPSYRRRRAVVDTVCELVQQQSNGELTMSELCAAANVSQRTLQYSFSSILGMSPIQFIRHSRLNGARRDLSRPNNATSVADVAAHWGFWHLSQFSKDYRRLFAERPSETLARYTYAHLDS